MARRHDHVPGAGLPVKDGKIFYLRYSDPGQGHLNTDRQTESLRRQIENLRSVAARWGLTLVGVQP